MNPEIFYENFKGLSSETLRMQLQRLDIEVQRLEDRINYMNIGRSLIQSMLAEREEG